MNGAPHGNAPLTRWAHAFALRRSVVLLLAMLGLVGMGEKLFLRFLPVYLKDLGAGALVIGLYGFLENGLGALYALPGGYLTDRLGHRRSLLLFAGLNLAGYALLAVQSWPVALVAVLFSSAWTNLSLPATFSLVGEQLPQGKRVMGLAVQAIIRRIPLGLGPVIGGAIFEAHGIRGGMRIALAIAAALTLAAVLMQWRLAGPDGRAAPHERLEPRALLRSLHPDLRALLVSDILIRFCEQIPYAFVVLWVVDRMGRSLQEFGWLTAIEMGTAASLYIPVALWVDSLSRRAHAAPPSGTSVPPVMDPPAAAPDLATERKPFVLATFVLFTAFPVALWLAHGWWGLVGAFVVRGFKEFGEPARKATIVDLAAPGAKARTVGLYYAIRDGIVAFAALLGGWLWRIDPDANLAAAFACGMIGTIVYAGAARTNRTP
jgi:hypothetical protein